RGENHRGTRRLRPHISGSLRYARPEFCRNPAQKQGRPKERKRKGRKSMPEGSRLFDRRFVDDLLHAFHFLRELVGLVFLLRLLHLAFESDDAVLDLNIDGAAFDDLIRREFLANRIADVIVGYRWSADQKSGGKDKGQQQALSSHLSRPLYASR